VKEVVLARYPIAANTREGLEGLLLKEQENDGMNIELELEAENACGAPNWKRKLKKRAK